MRRIAVIAFDGGSPFELAIPCEVFGTVRRDLADPWYELRVCACGDPPLRAKTGFSVDAPYRLHDLEWADTVIVPAWPDVETSPPPALTGALTSAYARGARVVSICTGAFVLGAAGLLDGRRAATHWMFEDALSRRFPDTQVVSNVLYVDEGNVLSSAGTAAGIDLCLHIVGVDFGVHVANEIARRMLVSPQRDGFQAQYVDRPPVAEPDGVPVAELLEWLKSRITEPLRLEDVAAQFGMTQRTLNRKFKSWTGFTVGRWLVSQRIRIAKELLETTDLSMDAVARKSGMGSAINMRKHFRNYAGEMPTDYRSQHGANRPGSARGTTFRRGSPYGRRS